MRRRPVSFVHRLVAAALVALAVLFAARPAGAIEPSDPAVQRAVQRGVEALKKKGAGGPGGYDSLAGYALLKCEVPPDDPVIEAHVAKVLARFSTGQYKPQSHHFYEAGCDLMFLELLHDDRYKPQMAAVVDYIGRGRLNNGAWTYVGQQEGSGGDQSITQYVVLGLWAAERAEVPVNPALWDGIAAWQIRVQQSSGGFTYHPNDGGGGGATSRTMTVAGISNMYVARQYLFGEIAQERRQRKPKSADPKTPPRFGVLKRVEADEVANAAAANEPEAAPDPKAPTNYNPRTPVGNLDAALRTSSVYFDRNFDQRGNAEESWPYYFWYGLERMGALGDVETIGGVNWYDAGADYLLKNQDGNGLWGGANEKTAFALLFLTRATSKILGREPNRGIDVGSGLLAGGRGLPEDLSEVVSVEDGQAETRKPGEPLDELFAALGDPATGETIAAQTAIVEKLRLGDREELVGQIDRVLELAEHPHYEIRRTAIWVLGRAEDSQYVDELVDALLDENLDVAVEARNALCFLSRKPRGLGETDDPFAKADPRAAEDQRNAVAATWQKDTHARWVKWVAEKRPYERRDRISTLQFAPADGEK